MNDALNLAEPNGLDILNDIIADYQLRTGRILRPGQPETLILHALAYRETLVRSSINQAIRNNLVEFAPAPMLDYLGDLVGVTRLGPGTAKITLRLTAAVGAPSFVVPAGTRVGTTDGKTVFVTETPTPLGGSILTAQAIAAATEPGTAANTIAQGATASVVLDPVAYLSAVEAVGAPSGGSNAETDDELRTRIKLAPNSFSVAGPTKAYAYFARSAHPSIIDVAVVSPLPGRVVLYPLTNNQSQPTSASILASVLETCSADTVRPLCDTVDALSPNVIHYDLNVDLTVFATADQNATRAEVIRALTAFTLERKAGLGRDVIRAKVLALSIVGGVYNAQVNDPFADLIVDETSVAVCDSIAVNVVAVSNG